MNSFKNSCVCSWDLWFYFMHNFLSHLWWASFPPFLWKPCFIHWLNYWKPKLTLQNIRFSQQCCLGFKSLSIWCCVIGWIVSSALKDHSVLIFIGQVVRRTWILFKPSIFFPSHEQFTVIPFLSPLFRWVYQMSRVYFLKTVSFVHIPDDVSTDLFQCFQNTQRTSLLMLHFMCRVKAKGTKCLHHRVICRHLCIMTIGWQQWKQCNSKV